jgi:hypothetical protein
MRLKGLLSAESSARLKPVVRKTLLPADGGRRMFVCTLKGTFSQPIVSLDNELLRRAVSNAFEEWGRDLLK